MGLWEDATNPCVGCLGNSKYVARRVVDMSETYWLVCKEYKCKRCAEAGRVKFFTVYDPVVLKLYHSSLVDDLDVVFTYKCAVSQSVADYIDDHAVAVWLPLHFTQYTST